MSNIEVKNENKNEQWFYYFNKIGLILELDTNLII